MIYCLLICAMPIGIKFQLLSQADIDKELNIIFPADDIHIPVQSVVPHPTISM